ncbi:MAG TPA: hypothetical protein VD811_04725 [Desulfuromonadales bacterium]|nr:hypothetical protein [Desulfuromonadales bacterium]
MTQVPTFQDFRKIVQETPGLCDQGLLQRKSQPELEDSKDLLLSEGFAAFVASCKWLSVRQFNKTVQRNAWSSYGLKEFVEREYGIYVPNGAFIAAVLYIGAPYRPFSDSPNLLVGIARGSLPPLNPVRT